MPPAGNPNLPQASDTKGVSSRASSAINGILGHGESAWRVHDADCCTFSPAATFAFLNEGIDQIMNKLKLGMSYSKYMELYTYAIAA